MKFGLVIVGLVTACLSLPTVAATLKFSNEIDLLAVDGKKVSGSILKGSEGLELASGQHQILFRVQKVVGKSSRDQDFYTSVPLIADFDVKNAKTISINIPVINSEYQAKIFDKNPQFDVINENGKIIPAVKDQLYLQGLVIAADFEVELAKYNAGNNPASVPSLAQITTMTIAPAVTHAAPATTRVVNPSQPVAQTSITLKGENVAEQMLQYWYQQADKETQQRFNNWTKKNTK